jgi:hypothetical protein
MARRRAAPEPSIEAREFRSVGEIDSGINKLQRRIKDLEELDIPNAVKSETGADDIVMSDVRSSIRDVFGPNSPEFNEHQYIRLWAGSMYIDMY